MQFSVIRTEVQEQLGLDQADSNNDTLVNRWINIVQQDVAGRWPWKWLYSRESVVTVTDKTAGTVSVNSGSTSVTGSGTSFADPADVGKYIQFSGSDDWYRVSAVGGATSLTLETAYAESDNLSGGTYTLRKFFYSLSSSADKILSIRNWDSNSRIFEIDYSSMDTLRPNPDSTGTSATYIPFGYDSSGNITFSLWPWPDDLRILEVRTLKRLTDLSADSDTSDIPAKWHHVLIAGAVAFGFMYMRKQDMAASWNGKYEQMIQQMKGFHQTTTDRLSVMGSVDGAAPRFGPKLPSDFPEQETGIF